MRTDHSGLYVVEFTHHKNGDDSSRALRVEGLAEEFRSLNAAKRRKKKKMRLQRVRQNRKEIGVTYIYNGFAELKTFI